MPRPDAAASAALSGNIFPIYFAYLDFEGDPVRANTSGRDLDIAGSGQPDLDGEYFGIVSDLVAISPVKITERGSDTVTATLSGLPQINTDLLNVLGDKTKYKGRIARLWRMIRDENRTQQGGIQHYYTGYMTNSAIGGDTKQQTVTITIENYLAAFATPSGRSYLDAEQFDPGDMSAKAALAIANGISGNPLVNNTGVGLGGGNPMDGDNGLVRAVRP